jgi:hypothetical protein
LQWELHAEGMALALAQSNIAQALYHQQAMNAIAQRIADNLQDPSLSSALSAAAMPAMG